MTVIPPPRVAPAPSPARPGAACPQFGDAISCTPAKSRITSLVCCKASLTRREKAAASCPLTMRPSQPMTITAPERQGFKTKLQDALLLFLDLGEEPGQNIYTAQCMSRIQNSTGRGVVGSSLACENRITSWSRSSASSGRPRAVRQSFGKPLHLKVLRASILNPDAGQQGGRSLCSNARSSRG